MTFFHPNNKKWFLKIPLLQKGGMQVIPHKAILSLVLMFSCVLRLLILQHMRGLMTLFLQMMLLEVFLINPLLIMFLYLMVLFTLNDLSRTWFCDHPRAKFLNPLSIEVPVLPRTTILLKIWPLNFVQCQLLRYLSTTQINELLSAIGEVDPSTSNLILFNLEHYKP